jgi:hypothetical protein
MAANDKISHLQARIDRASEIEEERPAIVLRSADQMASDVIKAWWLLKPYLERDASILLFGDLGTLKSFLALYWALLTALAGHTVVYLSAEGKGLGRRLKGWARERWGENWKTELAKLPFFGIERPLNLSAALTVADLGIALEEGAIEPALIVIDTLSKNSDGKVESSTEDATAYLNQLDRELRSIFKATVLLVHHTGHAEKNRARGPYALMANTDANFRVDRPDIAKLLITVTAGRMKDTESPPAFSMLGRVVETGDLDEDGNSITTLALAPSEVVAVVAPKRPTGKAQKAILTELERRQRTDPAVQVWTLNELRDIGKEIRLVKSTARDAIRGLIETGFLKQTIGGLALGYAP